MYRTLPLNLLPVVLLLFTTALPAQSIDLSQYKSKFPEEDALYLKLRESIDIDLVNGELDIRSSREERMLLLSENAAGYADKSIGYSSFNEILQIDAKTLVPHKGKFREVPVEEITDAERMSGGVFFDDVREKSFVFPGVAEGAITELSYSEVIKEPRFLGAFYFNSYVPVEASELVVSTDAGVSLQHVLRGEGTDRISYTVEEKSGKKIHRWVAEDLESMTFEANAPSLNYYEPHVIVYIDEYEGAKGIESVLTDVSGLYSWYRELTRDVNSSPDAELERITAELVADLDTDREKVRAIFNWVQDNIRYIAFEDGLGGFIPREASLVCTRKYGDCKDMASLTTEMLKYAGYEANLTWIGTRDIPYSYEEVPTPMVDNHMIASIELDGERIFLDATDERVGFGFPSSFIQGKQALVGKGDSYSLEPVPVISSDKNVFRETASIRVEEGTLTGQGFAERMGYPAFDMARRLTQVRPDRMDRALDGFLELGNNKFRILDFELSDFTQRDEPITVDYGLEIPDYATVVGDEIYLNMQLDRRLQHAFIDIEKRKLDREFDYQYQHEHRVELEIPEGYKVDYLPEQVAFEHDMFSFRIDYTQEENRVIMDRVIRLKTLLLPKEQFEYWNSMITLLDDAYQEVVVIVGADEDE